MIASGPFSRWKGGAGSFDGGNVIGDRQVVDQTTSGQGGPVGWAISSVVVWLVLSSGEDVKRTGWDLVCP